MHFSWILGRYIKAGAPLCFGSVHTVSAEEETSPTRLRGLSSVNLRHKPSPRKLDRVGNSSGRGAVPTGPYMAAAQCLGLTETVFSKFSLFQWDIIHLSCKVFHKPSPSPAVLMSLSSQKEI